MFFGVSGFLLSNVRVYRKQLYYATPFCIVFCSRILGVGSAILLGGKLIDMKHLTAVLEERGMSPAATYVLLSTANIIPQMSKKMNAILDAHRSRGVRRLVF